MRGLFFSPMTSSLRSSLFVVALLGLVAMVAFFGCRDTSVSSSDEEAMRNIYRSGLEMQNDPFVRAETLRAMKLTGDPELADHAIDLVDDPHPMVRVAALRKLVSANHPRARQRALLLFNRSDDDEEKYQIFDASVVSESDTLRRAIIERGLRDDAPRLRMRALEEGLLRQIDEAQQEGDDELLRHELLPELSDYIDDGDPQIAAVALQTIAEAGRAQWADEFIDRLADDARPVDERVDAARTLVFGGVADAEELFEEILDDVGAYDPDALGIPERQIDDRLLRLAVLGLTILGHPEFVDPAMEYLDDATTAETVEVLQVLAENPAEDASIALRTHMRDANATVRRQSIMLYGERDDIRPDALIGALRHDDYETQQMLVAILSQRFPDRWQEYLASRLADADAVTVEQTLRSMQTMLSSDEELASIAPLVDRLQELAVGENLGFEVDESDEDELARKQSIANIAAYLLFRVSDEGSFREVIRENPDPQTRYAYLEHLMMHEPEAHVDILRDYLYDDLFALRLMAATGLWRVFADELSWPAVEEGEEEQGDDG